MVKIDLTDTYYYVPLSLSSRKYVRFEWQGTFYEFTCLMFGLGPGPRIFTKLMKVRITLLRRLKIRLIIYFDDMLIMASLEEIQGARDTVVYLFRALGLVLNLEKSDLEPKQIMEFLCFLVDSKELTLSIPKSKMDHLMNQCRKTLTSRSIKLRKLARLIGKLQATAPAFNFAKLQVRYLQQELIQGIRKRGSYECQVHLGKEAWSELDWWINNLQIMNGSPIRLNPPEIFISTDAAKGRSGGWGAECQGMPTRGTWDQEERDLSINVLELLAAEYGLKSFLKDKKDVSVHLSIDNTTALSYIAKMGGQGP